MWVPGGAGGGGSFARNVRLGFGLSYAAADATAAIDAIGLSGERLARLAADIERWHDREQVRRLDALEFRLERDRH